MAELQADSGVSARQDLFVAEFRRWRDLSGLSRAALAKAMGYSRPYVSKVESGSEHASREFVKTADAALNTGGALQRAWREQEALRAAADTKPGLAVVTPTIEPAKGLLVEHDHAELRYDGGTYRLTQRPPSPKPSAIMKELGIAQNGDPVLRNPARHFALPAEAEDARRVISELQSATHRVVKAHVFGKGMGIAAPQVGIERAAAIVRPPGTDDVITLFNPRIIESSEESDEQYEGCLSFFDVRCLVPRPLVIHVEHQDITGERRITIFEYAIARLVAHEVDHLYGILCSDHMREGVRPIPIEQYRGTGTSWHYPATTDPNER